jgi:hypothetical protein
MKVTEVRLKEEKRLRVRIGLSHYPTFVEV